MNAIKTARQRIERDPGSESSRALVRLVLALQNETSFEVACLYKLDYDTFQLALSILEEWRLDHYYASKLKLLDISLQARALGQEPAGA
ncbi:MAG: hypothetical protein J7605_03215 [Variovorax sp.]|nr:hypothetical protein [Variovorax sp.]